MFACNLGRLGGIMDGYKSRLLEVQHFNTFYSSDEFGLLECGTWRPM